LPPPFPFSRAYYKKSVLQIIGRGLEGKVSCVQAWMGPRHLVPPQILIRPSRIRRLAGIYINCILCYPLPKQNVLRPRQFLSVRETGYHLRTCRGCGHREGRAKYRVSGKVNRRGRSTRTKIFRWAPPCEDGRIRKRDCPVDEPVYVWTRLVSTYVRKGSAQHSAILCSGASAWS
jgi:hypothetical protein